MRFSEKVASLVTERRGLMWSAVVLIAISSVGILLAFLRLDTEVLDLLPRGFESVEGLKIYNSEFAQTRELTFALLCQPEDVDKLEEFVPKFAGNAAMETDQPLTSPDSTMRIFPTVTNQPSISAFDCQKLMKQVNAFRVSARDGWDGGKLEVLITGRSAYVAEISLSMRHDII